MTWKVNSSDKSIFLTFDDGPCPDVTDKILDVLKKYDAKATFFCVGENIVSYPKLYSRIIEEGHQVGNHTYNHLNGRKTDTSTYLSNYYKCEKLVDTGLFRPPYGKISYRQLKSIRKQSKVIMWDVLSGDFDASVGNDQCFRNVINNCSNGSIIVFHDSLKAADKVLNTLPRVLDHFKQKGFVFKRI